MSVKKFKFNVYFIIIRIFNNKLSNETFNYYSLKINLF